MRYFNAIAAAAALIACSTSASAAPRLEKLWVAQSFSAPEGVAFAPNGDLLISNVAGAGDAKDGEGWITRLSVDGEILEPRWIDGLDAPKGMAVHDKRLYVSDIDRVRIFDAETGAPLSVVAVEGAGFLNDVTVWRGAVFLSDSRTDRILKLTDNGAEKWREGAALDGVNGLLGVETDGAPHLLIATMSAGALLSAKDRSSPLRTIAEGMVPADGIGLVPDHAGGGYLVSAWRGEIYHVAKDGAVTSLLNTRDDGIYQNDLTMKGDLVIVPNWEPGTVTAWRVKAGR